ncbi:MAG: GreA/GreB family elongation factor [Victivallaceae bacterium]|nr:GreA/GreB family elongation factor [Victivallaceae bacterium]
MNDKVIEDLFMAAAEQASAGNLEKLLDALKLLDAPDKAEIAEQLELVFEGFDEDLSESQALFCLALARLGIRDDASFRNILTSAIKALLPPYLNKLGFLRALGLRDRDIPLAEIIARYENMLRLKNNMLVFFENSNRWGRVSNIDAVSASVAVTSLTGGAFAVPLAITLGAGKIFESGASASKLAQFRKTDNFSGADYRLLAAAKSIIPLTGEEIEKIAYATAVSDIMTPEEFKTWWAASDNDSSGNNNPGRRFFEARSLQELHLLLNQSPEPPAGLDAAGTAALAGLFTRLKPAAASRDTEILAETISLLAPRCSDEQLRTIFTPLAGRIPFWPAHPESIPLENLNVWGTVAVKHVENIARVMKAIFPEEYLAAYTARLPLRCLNIFVELVNDELLYEAISNLPVCSCDILLWIWRNRKKHDDELLKLVAVEKTARALSADKLPKAWSSAQRELKQCLMDNKGFQEQLLKLVGEEIWIITSVLQTASFCNSSERQSLLIKLSRLSPALRTHLESGAGRRTVGQHTARRTEPLYTSVKSHQALLTELQDIVNVQIPENREALKAARAHGDFRENAEFDAAKERRNFLSRRRDELERAASLVQPLDFATVEVENYSVVGSAITVKADSGKEEQYFLVGAWDGNPDKNMISYKTRMGETLMHRKANDEITLPNGQAGVVIDVEKLPESIIEILRPDR